VRSLRLCPTYERESEVDGIAADGIVTRVLERKGFVHEGIKRRYLLHGGVRVVSTFFCRRADDVAEAMAT
jgi:hypothetical protein